MSILPAVHRYVREALAVVNRHPGNKYGTRVEVDNVVISDRMTTALGKAGVKRCKHDYDSFEYTIKISGKIFKADSNELRQTVFHEVAHIADHAIFGKMGHGDTWKAIMGWLGVVAEVRASEARMKAIGYVHEKRKFAYHVVACVQCGRQYHVSPRRLKVISKYRCRDDGKPLKDVGEIIIK